MGYATNPLLLQLGVILFLAVIAGTVFERIGLPAVLGYALAGYVVGATYPEVKDLVGIFAELGIAVLLFYIGMEFSIRKFMEFGVQALVLSPVKSGIGFLMGYTFATLLGFPTEVAIVAGATTAVSSTGIISNTILERKMQNTLEARTALSMLILEDIFSVLFITFLLTRGEDITSTFIHIIMVFLLLLTVGVYISRLIFHFGGRYIRPDTIAVFSLGALIIFSYGFSVLGIPPTLGAFFAGVAISELATVPRIEKELESVKKLFVLLFFTSIGLLYTPVINMDAVILGVLLFFSQILAVSAATLLLPLLGNSIRSSSRFFMLDLPLGEFSLFFTATAASVGIPQADVVMGAVFVAIILTNMFSNFLWKREEKIIRTFRKILPLPERTFHFIPEHINIPKGVVFHVVMLISLLYVFIWALEKGGIYRLIAFGSLLVLIYPVFKLISEMRDLIAKFMEKRLSYMGYFERKELSRRASIFATGVIVYILSIWLALFLNLSMGLFLHFLILLGAIILFYGAKEVFRWNGRRKSV